jgi:hypothetical protein
MRTQKSLSSRPRQNKTHDRASAMRVGMAVSRTGIGANACPPLTGIVTRSSAVTRKIIKLFFYLSEIKRKYTFGQQLVRTVHVMTGGENWIFLNT